MPDRFIHTFSTKHVIVYSLQTTRGTGSLKHCRNVEPFEELEIIRIELVKGFIVEPMLTAKFSYLLFVDIVGIVKKKKKHQLVALASATLDLWVKYIVVTNCTFVL